MRAAGRPDDEPRCHQGRLYGFSFNQTDDSLNQPFGGLANVLADRREWGRNMRRQRNVVKTHDGNIVRYRQAVVLERVHGIDGDDVRHRKECVKLCFPIQQLADGTIALTIGAVGIYPESVVRLDARFAQRLAIAFVTARQFGRTLRCAAEQGDAPMPGLQQVARRLVTTVDVVTADRVSKLIVDRGTPESGRPPGCSPGIRYASRR